MPARRDAGVTGARRRLFFALWPDDALRVALAARLEDLLRDYPCRPQRPDQWHLTLEFLGNVAESRMPAVREAASSVRAAGPFEVVLDRLEHWPRPQVLCLTTAQPVPENVTRLVRLLRDALAARGFTPEQREYRAHLTLARKATRRVPVRAVEPLHWRADAFALVESISDAAGSRYEPLAWWNPGT